FVFFRETGELGEFVFEHLQLDDHVAQELAAGGVCERPCEGQLVDFPDVVQKSSGQQQIAVDHFRIVPASQVAKLEKRNHVFQQAADESMVQRFRSRGVLVRLLDLRVVDEGAQQRLQVWVAHAGNKFAERAPQRGDVFGGTGKIIVKLNFGFLQGADFVQRNLETPVEFVHQPTDLDEVVLLETVDVVRHVVPHLRFHVASAVSQSQRQVQVAALFGFSLLRHDYKRRGNHLVLKSGGFGNVEILHGLR